MTTKAAAAIKPTDLPRSFRRIRLELAREPKHPAGSSRDGYLLVAPLDEKGYIDADLWRAHRAHFGAVRFRSGQEDDIGHLVHNPGGTWKIHYDVKGDEDDETPYHFERERFTVGEYVSIREGDVLHTFRVVSIEHV